MARVLIVDDQPNIVRLLRFHLEKEHEVRTAFNGEEALAAVAEQRPDLILLDVVMPVLDGYRVLHRLKSDPETEGIAVVLLTKKDDDDDVALGYNIGADYYVTKPFNVSDVTALVRRHLAGETGATG